MSDVGDVVCSGCEMLACQMLEMRNVGDVGCLGCEMQGMWGGWDVGYLVCRIFRMWNVQDVAYMQMLCYFSILSSFIILSILNLYVSACKQRYFYVITTIFMQLYLLLEHSKHWYKLFFTFQKLSVLRTFFFYLSLSKIFGGKSNVKPVSEVINTTCRC